MPVFLKGWRERAGLSQQQVADALGTDKSTVSKLELGKRRLSTDWLARFAKLYKTTDGDLLSPAPEPPGAEREPVFSEPDPLVKFPQPIRTQGLPLDVPVWGVAIGGSVGDFQFNGHVVDFVRRPPVVASVKTAFAIFAQSDSMYPLFEPGDLLYVNPNRPPRTGDYVIVELHGTDAEPGPAFVKKLVRHGGSKLVLGQFNPPKDDIQIDMKRVRHIYRIIPNKELLGI